LRPANADSIDDKTHRAAFRRHHCTGQPDDGVDILFIELSDAVPQDVSGAVGGGPHDGRLPNARRSRQKHDLSSVDCRDNLARNIRAWGRKARRDVTRLNFDPLKEAGRIEWLIEINRLAYSA